MADLDMNMNKLREEAARRAREMQARAHIPPPRRTQKEPAPQQPPPEPAQKEPEPELAAQPGSPEEGSLLNAFFQDKEKTIILALLLLLSGDEKNQELLFALMFLLM